MAAQELMTITELISELQQRDPEENIARTSTIGAVLARPVAKPVLLNLVTPGCMIDPLLAAIPQDMPPMLELGSVYDPTTAGRMDMRYFTPEGKIETYRAPGEWDGDAEVGQFLFTLGAVRGKARFEAEFQEDIDQLLREIRYSLDPREIAFWRIETRKGNEPDWTIARGTRVTMQNSWMLVSGVVTLRRWTWWLEKFRANGLRARTDLCSRFQEMRNEGSILRRTDGWGLENTIFAERDE